nr:transposase, mutator type [Tanacetum cinerariifolium]
PRCKEIDEVGEVSTIWKSGNNSACLGLRKKYRLNLKNDMPPRDNERSGKEQEAYVVTLEAGQSGAVGNDGSSQVLSQVVNNFYLSYNPYEESHDPNFDPFADLYLFLPPVNNREGKTSPNVEVEDRTEGEDGTKVEHGPEGKDETKNVEIEVDEDTEEDTDQDDDDSQDSDYLVDEDNNVDDVDSNMEDFEYNIDKNVEFMRCRERVEPATEFPNKDEVKAYINEHLVETRREIRMGKNDNQRVRAVCRGVIPSLLTFENIAKKYTIDWGGDEFYQVSGPFGDQVMVNVVARTCTCRRWELTEYHPQVGRPPKQRKKLVDEMEVLKIVKNGKLSRKHKTIIRDKCKTKDHNLRSCTGPRVLKSNKRKVPSKGMDLDTDAPIASQSRKRATTEAASSATQTDKGKAPTKDDGPQKKRAPRKKVIVLG